jgi:parallel beta-helix repeat protein
MTRLNLSVGLLGAIGMVLCGGCRSTAPQAESALPVGVPAATCYVATDGNDAWSGRLPAPNPERADGPFATLERARDEIRKLKSAGTLPPGGFTVAVRGGTYALPQTFKLEAQDSGTAESPVTYRAYGSEKPILLGGRTITGFVPHQGRILKADIGAQGLKGVNFRQLFFNGVRQPLARYPNLDPKNPYGGGWAFVDGKPLEMYTNYPTDNKRLLAFKESDARRWSRPEEGEVFIFARYNWWNNLVRIAALDPAARTLTLAADASYPIRPTDRYFVQGLLEELDAPGEWYLDSGASTLYFWPPEALAGGTVCAPALRTILQLGPGCSQVTFRGFTLEGCAGNAVELKDSSDCRIAGNTIRNVGDYNGNAVVVTGGFRNGIVGNDIYDIGRDAINLTGGDRITLTPGDSYADNNYIHHVGIYYKWGCGITLTGCGLRATHNLIHDCPRAAIQFQGNNLIMDYNHMRHLCLESEDAAGIGTGGRDWISSRGSAVRYNLIHDVLGYGRMNGKWVSPFFAWGIYLDDNTGGVDVIGNIVTRCGRAGLHLHNARDTVVENNVFADNTMYQIELSGWTATHPFWKSHFPTMVKGYESVLGQPAWKAMRGMALHPQDAPLPNGLIMAGNVFERNIFASHDPAASLYRVGNVDFEHNRWNHNLLWQYGEPLMIEGVGKLPAAELWPEWQKQGEDPDSLAADPLFKKPRRDDYRLRPESPALALGFQPIPVEKIGPYPDDLRASWPIIEAEGAREHPLVTERPSAKEAATAAPPRYPQPFAVPRLVSTVGAVADAAAVQRAGLELKLAETPARLPVAGPPCSAWVGHDGENLYVALRVPTAAATLNRGETWGGSDGAELCFANATGRKLGPTFVIHGYVTGKHDSSTDAGALAEPAQQVGQATRYTATVAADSWTALWVVPLSTTGIKKSGKGTKLAFNLGVRRTASDEWICWAGALAQNWRVESAGILVLE